jgi:hypothetical protein
LIFGEDLFESTEATLPGGATLGEPLFGAAHDRWLDTAGADATDFLRSHQPAGLEHLQVLDDRRQGERQWSGELANGRWAAGEALEHVPSRGIGQGVEDAIERWRRRGSDH